MWPMEASPNALARLGALVASRRAELRLPRRPAARLAGISNTTWTKVEAGEPVRDVTYAGVETALQWRHGSCNDVLAGGDPTPLAAAQEQPAAEPRLIGKEEGLELWAPGIAEDMREAVRDAVMVTIPGATGAEIQEIERRVEEELRRRINRRHGAT